jgi:hypothetical protein
MVRRTIISGACIALTLAATAPTAGSSTPGGVLHISSHLPSAAQVSIDGRPAVTAPGEGEVEATVAAGAHVLKVTGPGGVAYTGHLNLRTSQLMHWHGRAYWCVNLLKTALEPYSRSECQEEVTDAG